LGTIAAEELADSSNGDGEQNRRSTNTATATTTSTMENDAPQGPTVVIHDTAWYEDENAAKLPINGSFSYRNWKSTNAMNVHFGVGSDLEKNSSRLDYFLMMYPPSQIAAMLQQLTNTQLRMQHKKEMTRGE
jgi:hypothetical protein